MNTSTTITGRPGLGVVIGGWLGGSLTTAALLLTGLTFADGDITTDDVPTLIPYEGRLERDGAPLDEDVAMTFRIWDGTTLRWSERRDVPVTGGRFTVLLGDTSGTSAAALATAIRNADDLELEVVVHAASGDVTLSGRKPLSVAPYAMVASAGLDVEAAGQVVVEADRVVTADGDGPLVIRDNDGNRLAIDGDELDSSATLQLNRASKLEVDTGGALTIGAGELAFGASTSYGDGGAALEHTVSGNKLTINPGGALGDQTYVDGVMTFNGDVTGLQGESTGDNDYFGTGGCETFDLGLVTGELTQYCSAGKAMVGGTWGGNQSSTKGLQFMRCCPISFKVW